MRNRGKLSNYVKTIFFKYINRTGRFNIIIRLQFNTIFYFFVSIIPYLIHVFYVKLDCDDFNTADFLKKNQSKHQIVT